MREAAMFRCFPRNLPASTRPSIQAVCWKAGPGADLFCFLILSALFSASLHHARTAWHIS